MLPLVGRAPVVAALRRAVADTSVGRGRFVLLAGEPGIGKTALAADAARHAEQQGATVVWGVCVEGGGVPDLWPWPDVLRALGATVPARSAGTDAETIWFDVATSVVDEVRATAGDGPVVVVLDDLQWAGPSAVRVLDLVRRQMARDPVLLLGTYRDVELAAGHPLAGLVGGAEVMTLGGLDATEVAELLAHDPAIGGPRPSAEVAADVHRRTGGNPFFVQQVGRLLAADTAGSAGLGGTTADRTVPVAVEEAIGRRFARLPQATAMLLDTAAVGGTDVDAALLANVASLSYAEVIDRLAPAVTARVLRETDTIGGYRFEHDLYRESRYATLDPATRARTHLDHARALLARGEATGERRPGDLAFHYARAVPAAPPAEALPHVVAAARDATGRLAHEEATRHWRDAVRLAELAGAVPVNMRLDEAEALLRAGASDAARRAFERAAEADDGDAVSRARAAHGLHRVGPESGAQRGDLIARLTAADAELAATGPAGEPGTAGDAVPGRPDGALAALVRAALARELADGPDRDEPRARELAGSAVALARASGDPAALAACLFAQHDVEWVPGNAGRRLAILDASIAAADAGGQAALAGEATQLRFAALVERADPRAAAALADLSARATRLGQPRLRYLAATRRAAYAIAAGPTDDTDRLVDDAYELGQMVGDPDAYGVRATQIVALALTRGGPIAAGASMRAANRPVMPTELELHQRVFELLAAGDTGAAAALLRAIDEAGGGSEYRWRALAKAALEIELAVAAGAPELCPARARYLTPYAGEMLLIGGAVAILPPVDHYLGLAAAASGDTGAARRHFAAAAAVAERIGALGAAARSRAALAGLAATAEFRLAGGVWTLGYAGKTVALPDAKGLRDLARLLSAPGQEIGAQELAGDPAPDSGADDVLDQRAKAEYKRRLAHLDTEIDDAVASHDEGRLAWATTEREALIAALASAYGLGGRPRRLGDPGERARTTVTARIRDSLRRIERAHPELGAHLRASVSTGRSCVYQPSSPVRWHVSHGS